MDKQKLGLFKRISIHVPLPNLPEVEDICAEFEQRLSNALVKIDSAQGALERCDDVILDQGLTAGIEQLQEHRESLEQRLAEAEAISRKLAYTADTNEHRFKEACQVQLTMGDEIAQLRARCGELEKSVTAVVKWFEDGMPGKDDPRANMLRVLNLGAVLTAAPQPAKEQVKCKNCNGKGWTWLAGAPAHETNKYPCEECNLQGHQL